MNWAGHLELKEGQVCLTVKLDRHRENNLKNFGTHHR